jgi:hypothetical protein
MKYALGIWTALCSAVVVFTFITAPGWDTDGFLLSGAQVFAVVALLTLAVWIVGIGVILAIDAYLYRGRDRRWIVVLVAVLTPLVLLGADRLRDGGDMASEAGSSFVSFDTAHGDPDWSPDGRLVAFASNRGHGGVYVMRPDGTGMRRLFGSEASDVDWSPDGNSMAFAGRGGIYLLNVADGKARRLLAGSAFSRPAWAPSGRELAVVREDAGVFRTFEGRSRAPAPRSTSSDSTEATSAACCRGFAARSAGRGRARSPRCRRRSPLGRPTGSGSHSRRVTARSSLQRSRPGVG